MVGPGVDRQPGVREPRGEQPGWASRARRLTGASRPSVRAKIRSTSTQPLATRCGVRSTTRRSRCSAPCTSATATSCTSGPTRACAPRPAGRCRPGRAGGRGGPIRVSSWATNPPMENPTTSSWRSPSASTKAGASWAMAVDVRRVVPVEPPTPAPSSRITSRCAAIGSTSTGSQLSRLPAARAAAARLTTRSRGAPPVAPVDLPGRPPGPGTDRGLRQARRWTGRATLRPIPQRRSAT